MGSHVAKHICVRMTFITFVTCIGLSACTSAAAPNPTPPPTATVRPVGIGLAATGIAGIPRSAGKPRVLVWNPNSGHLALYAEGEAPLILRTNVSPNSFALPCGNPPGITTRDSLGLFLGGGSAQPALFPLNGGVAVPLGETTGLTCALSHRFQFSPDAGRVGLILYQADALRTRFSVGKLLVLSNPEGVPLHQAMQVVAFALYDNGAVYLQYYPDDDGRAVDADLRYWDGETDRALQQDIVPLGEDCQFIAGQVARAARRIFTLIGERCRSNGSTWRLLETDLMDGKTTNLVAETITSDFLLNTSALDMWLLPDNDSQRENLLIALPSGQDSDTVTLSRFTANGGRTPLLQNVVVDQFPPDAARRLRFSPDRHWLSAVTRATDGTESLYVLDLQNATAIPNRIAGGTSGDRIIDMAWSEDSGRVYIARTGDDNTLVVYDVQTDRTRLITRGLFQQLTLSPDSRILAALEQKTTTSGEFRYDLVLLDTTTAVRTILIEGKTGDIVVQPLSVR